MIDSKQTINPHFIRRKRLLQWLAFSSSTLTRRVADGTFPQPARLGPGVVAWRVEDVQRWIEAAQ